MEAIFDLEPPWDGGTKIYSNGLGHMTSMASMPIYGNNNKKYSALERKTIKNILLWNEKANDFESWYALLGAQVQSSVFKWWPWVDLELFCGKVKFGRLRFFFFFSSSSFFVGKR